MQSIPRVAKIVSASIVTLIIAILVGGFVLSQRVEAGGACAQTTFGSISGDAGPGIHARVPGVIKYRCFTGLIQTLDIVANEDAMKTTNATYKDYPITGKTSSGVTYSATLSLSYMLPLENVQTVYQKVGKTDAVVFQKGVLTPLRTIAPQILNMHTADELYYGNLQGLSDEILVQLRPAMLANGLVVTAFGLKAFDFDDKYEERISNKNVEIELAKQKVLEQETAKAEAERQRIKADGDAVSAVIAAQGLADSAVISAEAAAQSVTIAANADAQANNLIGQSYSNNPTLLEMARIQAITAANTIYIPTDSGVIPILDLGGTTTP